eukprot:403365236
MSKQRNKQQQQLKIHNISMDPSSLDIPQQNHEVQVPTIQDIQILPPLKSNRTSLVQAQKIIQNTTKPQDQINPLKEYGTVTWLKRRFKKKASLTYMNTPSQLKRIQALEMLFKNFDDDGSEVSEMHQMFQQFGFDISQHDMRRLFAIIKSQQAGKMDLEEFKEFMLNQKVAIEFKKLMRHVRSNERGKLEEDKMLYIPMNFNSMLNYIYHQIQHQDLTNAISGVDKSISNKNMLRQDMEQFLKLFEFERVPKEENFTTNAPSSNIQSPVFKYRNRNSTQCLIGGLNDLFGQSQKSQITEQQSLEDAMSNVRQKLENQTKIKSSRIEVFKVNGEESENESKQSVDKQQEPSKSILLANPQFSKKVNQDKAYKSQSQKCLKIEPFSERDQQNENIEQLIQQKQKKLQITQRKEFNQTQNSQSSLSKQKHKKVINSKSKDTQDLKLSFMNKQQSKQYNKSKVSTKNIANTIGTASFQSAASVYDLYTEQQNSRENSLQKGHVNKVSKFKPEFKIAENIQQKEEEIQQKQSHIAHSKKKSSKNLKYFIEELHGTAGSQKNSEIRKQKIDKFKLKPYIKQEDLIKMKELNDSICRDRSNFEKTNQILQNQTFLPKPKLLKQSHTQQEFFTQTLSSIKPDDYKSYQTLFSPIANIRQSRDSSQQQQPQLTSTNPSQERLSTREIMMGLGSKRLLTFKEAMSLPAFDLKNNMKMRLIKNSMDIVIKDVPELQKLNVFKVAKSLQSNKQRGQSIMEIIDQQQQSPNSKKVMPIKDPHQKVKEILLRNQSNQNFQQFYQQVLLPDQVKNMQKLTGDGFMFKPKHETLFHNFQMRKSSLQQTPANTESHGNLPINKYTAKYLIKRSEYLNFNVTTSLNSMRKGSVSHILKINNNYENASLHKSTQHDFRQFPDISQNNPMKNTSILQASKNSIDGTQQNNLF